MNKSYLILLLLFFGKMSAQEVYMSDWMFKYKLLNIQTNDQIVKNLLGVWTVIDTNYNDIIEADEAAYVAELHLPVTLSNCCNYISSLEGIQAFTNLQVLDISGNHLTELDVSGLVHIWSINCSSNWLTSLNVNGLTGMQNLTCTQNQLTTLDLSGLTTLSYVLCPLNQLTSIMLDGAIAMEGLNCNDNQLTGLDFSDCPQLNYLESNNNVLTALDFTACPLLQTVKCDNNQIASISFAPSYPLQELRCNNNLLTSLDVSGSTGLWDLQCKNNQLVVIDLTNQKNSGVIYCDNNPALEAILVKNGLVNNYGLTFSNCPNLKYICIDDNEETIINTKIAQYGLTGNVNVNNYCSFAPGGVFYTIQGSNKFDLNNNGCDTQDISIPNVRFNITGSATGSFISDADGNYSFPVQAGLHTITPVLENPTYYTISPASAQISMPSAGSPFTQNFCVTLSTPKPDLEVVVVPLNAARPGFDARYGIIYKNKGNTLQNSGNVNVTFEDVMSDFVSASPNAVQSGNLLSWTFTDLFPFETRLIEFTINLNSPMEDPPVYEGTLLAYTANVTSSATDTTPLDNTFRLDQNVVNSFDPNDKTCLEGEFATPDVAGKFVHYMIRFENTGTFAAENIVVKDVINTEQFIETSLIPLKGSHPFVTRINGNKVEFIMENINLPFDDANNDGYIAFKIKTKSTLTVGDTFTNAAAIYFDYNFPIITNDATTTIQVLGTPDFTFSEYIAIYPNPADDAICVKSTHIKIRSVSIYNSLGQLLLTVPDVKNLQPIDVSSLKAGHYYLKVFSDNGTSSTKFIKK